MADFFWFSDEQWSPIEPLLPRDTRGMPRVDDRRVPSGIVHALKSGESSVRWSDCPEHVCGPKKILYNRFRRWADKGVWERIFSDLAGVEGVPSKLFIDSSCIKVHRTAGGAKGGPWLMVSADRDCQESCAGGHGSGKNGTQLWRSRRIAVRLGLGGRDMPDGPEQAVIVEPIDPAQRGHSRAHN